MNTLIRTELLKQRTLRIYSVGVGATLVTAGLISVAVLGAAGHQDNEPLSSASLNQVLGAPVSVVTVIALMLGVIGMAGEYRHQTITNTFLATPRRGDVVLSKLVAHAITGSLLGLASLTVTLLIALPWLGANGTDIVFDSETARVAFGGIISIACYGALGVAVGALIRNQTAACAVVLTWLLAVEGLIGDVLHDSALVRWLPVAAGQAIVRTDEVGGLLPVPVAIAVFAAYVGLFAIAATRITLQRDVT
jgi:ABC-2 type transport system permease protein